MKIYQNYGELRNITMEGGTPAATENRTEYKTLIASIDCHKLLLLLSFFFFNFSTSLDFITK